ncbi:MAG TPA: 50S ribosomal protein L15 [Patescibacteria group bacterium]
MEILNKLTSTTTKQMRRVGRGIGSKKGGHTTGRGQKGDKSRGATRITFDGTKIKKSWIKRLPFMKGKHRVLAYTDLVSNFNFTQIEKWFKAGDVVTREALIKKAKMASYDVGRTIKILSTGNLTKALTFKGVKLSQSAAKKITAAGGKIEA